MTATQLGLRPYPAYKDSVLPWLGSIPAHWNDRRAKYFLREVDERSTTGTETLLSLRQLHGLVPHVDVSEKPITSAQLIGYKRTEPGDIVMNRMQAGNGMFARTPIPGLVSPDYAVLRPTDIFKVEYFVELFKTPLFRAIFRSESKGLGTGTSGFLRLYTDRFGQISMPMPPLLEQEQILAFLRAADGRIGRLIQMKRRLIGLLNERKQVIIHRAVTRGLDPDVPLKPSGMPWLGDVPQHWEVKKLKYVAAFSPSKSERGNALQPEDEVVFLPMERIGTDGSVDCGERRRVADVAQGFTYFRRGDVVVAKITPCFENGKGAYLGTIPTEYGFGTTELIVLRAAAAIEPRYLYALTALKTFRMMGEESMTGAAGQQRVPVDFLREFVIPLPPVAEQEAILTAIADEARHADDTVSRARREIELLREYRTRLIADVVTGKLDVRGAPLPEDADAEMPDAAGLFADDADAEPLEGDGDVDADE